MASIFLSENDGPPQRNDRPANRSVKLACAAEPIPEDNSLTACMTVIVAATSEEPGGAPGPVWHAAAWSGRPATPIRRSQRRDNVRPVRPSPRSSRTRRGPAIGPCRIRPTSTPAVRDEARDPDNGSGHAAALAARGTLLNRLPSPHPEPAEQHRKPSGNPGW